MSDTDQDPAGGLDDRLRVALSVLVRPVADQDGTIRAVRWRAIRRRRRVRAGLIAAVVLIAVSVVSGLSFASGSPPNAGTRVSTSLERAGTVPRSVSSVPRPVARPPGSNGTQRVASVPPPLPPPCPPATDTPAWDGGRYCGPTPPAGTGSGPDGECTSTDTAPPCGPGVVVGRYYAYTLPGTCDGLIIFDGRQWVSDLPPAVPEPPMHVWMSLGSNGGLGFIAPTGAIAFQLYTGQPLNVCQK